MSVRVLSAVWEGYQGQPSHKMVLLCLADFADERGSCFPAVETIARKCCIHRVSVQRALSALEGSGWLTIDRSAGGRPGSSHRFRITPIEGLQNAAPANCDPLHHAAGGAAPRSGRGCTTQREGLHSAARPVTEPPGNHQGTTPPPPLTGGIPPGGERTAAPASPSPGLAAPHPAGHEFEFGSKGKGPGWRWIMAPIQADGVACANLSDARAWVGLALRAGFTGSDAREALRRIRWILAECRARNFRVRWAREVPGSVEADCRRHFDPPAEPDQVEKPAAPEPAPAAEPAARRNAYDDACAIVRNIDRNWLHAQPDHIRKSFDRIHFAILNGAGFVPASLLILAGARSWPMKPTNPPEAAAS